MKQDFEITNESIQTTKEDIIRFKNSSKYQSIEWFNSKTEDQKNFVTDYMASRKLSTGFDFYNTITYTLMCRNWNLGHIDSKWHERDDKVKDKWKR